MATLILIIKYLVKIVTFWGIAHKIWGNPSVQQMYILIMYAIESGRLYMKMEKRFKKRK